MSIRDEFKDYIDGVGLNCPHVGSWPPGQFGSDNGPLFTSEMFVMIKKNGQLTEQDKTDFAQKIGQCIDPEGILSRVPVGGQDDGLESVDDHYGVFNGCIELGNTDIPRKILKATIKYKGSLDNENPGKWQFQTFLIRQPQLLAAMVAASFPSLWNPLHWLVRLLFLPTFLIAAFLIAISCIGKPADACDERRLSWHLQNCLKKVSLSCKLASYIWMWRLNSTYVNRMKDVAHLYYTPSDNPYAKWWITD